MGKNVLITGASNGIGAATAILFAQKGYNVAVHYNTDKAAADAVVNCCRKQGSGRIIAVRADISSSVQVNAMVNEANASLGDIDILINNAGIASQKLLQDVSEEEWDRIFSVNTKGMFLCTKAVLPQMINNKKGSIVNVSSIWGQVGASCEVVYSSTKAAVIGFTKALAKEVGLSGVRVNCVASGVVKTKMTACFSEEVLSSLADEIPLNRLGTPDEIAESIFFLASENSSYITGQVLGVNGGMA